MAFLDNLKDKFMPKEEKNELTQENSDSYGIQEQKDIVNLILEDLEADSEVQKEWVEKRKKSLEHYHALPPSQLEPDVSIRSWQSDRNLGICPAIVDIYQSTLSSSCWNPESIHFIATEENDVERKDDLERFAKWMVGPAELNMTPEVDDFIANKVTQGFSCFEIYRDVWYEWVDRRIPNKGQDGRLDGTFTTKTEKVRFEKAVIENIDNLDDIIMPRYGDEIQKLPHIMRMVHLTGDKVLQYGKQGMFLNIDAKMVDKLKNAQSGIKSDSIDELKADILGLADVVDAKFRAQPIDIIRWYGWYTKNGKTERYRFMIEPISMTFLSGKPLRKIMRVPKYPFVGGPFEKIPGQLRGRDMTELIRDPVNAINLTFNQKSDFQYLTNCPFGFHKAGEGYTKGNYDLEPGVNYATEGNPAEEIYFPNIQRSMAWAEQDIRILNEVIEKRTGAASYFQTSMSKDTTATRDMIVKEKSDTRFGKWIARIQAELSEAVTMALSIYQDHVPDHLAERILGENGKKLFPNLSIETIRYNGDVRMEPDITAGSKAYDRQVKLWGFQALMQTMWFDPRLNPKGNWLLVSDTMKSQGFPAPERYLPPMPKPEMGTGQVIDSIWNRLMQGEVVEPEENWNIPEVLAGLYKKREENYFDLDKEYRPNLDTLLMETEIAMRLFMQKVMQEQAASEMAKRAIVMGGGQAGQPNAVPTPPMQPPTQQPGMMGGEQEGMEQDPNTAMAGSM